MIVYYSEKTFILHPILEDFFIMENISIKAKDFLNTLFHATVVSPEDRMVLTKNSVRDAYLVALFFTIFSLINFKDGSMDMMMSTIAGALICFLGGTLTFIFHKDIFTKIGFFVSVAFLFSYYGWIGGNDGFAILWILLVPFTFILIFKGYLSFALSIYYLVYLIVICWSPVSELVPYRYNHEFLLRFPVLYFFDFILSAGVLYHLQLAEIDKEKNRELSYEIKQKENSEHMLEQSILLLSKTIEAKDHYTRGHSQRVAEYSRLIAEKAGKNEEEQKQIYYAGLLHDIGKIRIPDSIINKKGKLTDEEYGFIKLHPLAGEQILSGYSELSEFLIGAKFHQERYDGRGYPFGLSGEEIPEIARIIGVADSYDAMTSNRSYRKTLPQEVVRSEIEKNLGTQFDPVFGKIMLKIIDDDKDYVLRQKEKTKKTVLLCCPKASEEKIIAQINDENFEILTSITGEQCMLSVLSNDVDLVVIDQGKAGIKTFDLVNMIQSFNDKLPIVLICSSETHHCVDCPYHESRIMESEIENKLYPYVLKLLSDHQ